MVAAAGAAGTDTFFGAARSIGNCGGNVAGSGTGEVTACADGAPVGLDGAYGNGCKALVPDGGGG
jgi:hypothetical protein